MKRGPSRRAQEIEPFHVMKLLARARELEAEGRSIIHMEIGEPDFPTPEPIRDAGIKALQKGEVYYTQPLGLTELRRAVAGFYRTRYGVDLAPERVLITTGASGALMLACAALVDVGDEVLIAVDAASDYQLTPDLLDLHWSPRAAAALVASPSNPTGTLVSTERLSAMAELVEENGAHLIVDEIYHGLVYEGDYTTALAFTDEVFVINSFSKYFNMTGWRLGWLVAPERYVPELDKLAQNIYLAPPTPAQHAALAAFEPETLAILEARRAEFKARRDYLVPALRNLGFEIPVMPQGAFYVYANCSLLTRDAFGFAHDLLERAGVAITPGVDFGVNAPQRHVRFAYTNSIERLEEGVRRIAEFLKKQ